MASKCEEWSRKDDEYKELKCDLIRINSKVEPLREEEQSVVSLSDYGYEAMSTAGTDTSNGTEQATQKGSDDGTEDIKQEHDETFGIIIVSASAEEGNASSAEASTLPPSTSEFSEMDSDLTDSNIVQEDQDFTDRHKDKVLTSTRCKECSQKDERIKELESIIKTHDRTVAWLEEDNFSEVSLWDSDYETMSKGTATSDITESGVTEDKSHGLENSAIRCFKLFVVVSNIFPKILQSIMKACGHTPAEIYNLVQRTGSRMFTYSEQLELEQLLRHGYDEINMILMFKLINICLVHHSIQRRLAYSSDPNLSIGDDLEILRQVRNKLFHRTSTVMSKQEYDSLYDTLKAIFNRIDNYLAFYQDERYTPMLEEILNDKMHFFKNKDNFSEVSLWDSDYETMSKDKSHGLENSAIRCFKLFVVVSNIFPKILQSIMKACGHTPAEIYKLVQRTGSRTFTYSEQLVLEQLLLHGYDEINMILMFKILRNIRAVPFPIKHGKAYLPDVHDDLEKLRLFRNKIFHRTSTVMSKQEYDSLYVALKAIFNRIDNFLAFHQDERYTPMLEKIMNDKMHFFKNKEDILAPILTPTSAISNPSKDTLSKDVMDKTEREQSNQ